jgi:hypothetical protein
MKYLEAMRAARLVARRIARIQDIDMAYGWQTNDDTGELEPGYCPLEAVGPCFVVRVVGIAYAKGSMSP